MRKAIWFAALIGAVLMAVAITQIVDSGSPLLTPKHLLIALVILLMIFGTRSLRFWRR
jgi:hypothetical protein